MTQKFLLFVLMLLISACSTTTPKNSSIKLNHARTIDVIARGNSTFSNGLILDILQLDVDEAYRFTELETFGEIRSRLVFKQEGEYHYAILEGAPSTNQTNTNQVVINSSAFGNERITKENFQKISTAFKTFDICNVISDTYDPEDISTDGDRYSFESIIDGNYCFAWFNSELIGNRSIPAEAFDSLFEQGTTP